MSLQAGMMKSTGKYAEGEISTTRFILSYYSRFFLGLLTLRSVKFVDQSKRNPT
jgi:hypothetical protein